jgi:hypothetical protein
VKYIPAWFPGAGFKVFAAEARKAGHELVQLPFQELKNRMVRLLYIPFHNSCNRLSLTPMVIHQAKGTARPSFVTNALDKIPEGSPREMITDIQEVAATMYGGTPPPSQPLICPPFLWRLILSVCLAAALDTILSTITSCVLALVLNPSVQTRAQAELNAQIGSPTSATFRLPTFSDRPHLPYIDAILKESLRWLTAVTSGVPHATTEDDVYRGWRIPKGSIVIANAWAMLHDPKTYADPFDFRPERFLPSEGKDTEPDPGIYGSFGFGRRYAGFLIGPSLWRMS